MCRVYILNHSFENPYTAVPRHSELKKCNSDIMALLYLGSTWFQSWLLRYLICFMIYVKTSMPMPIEHL
jgi:hypothetical protein